MLRPHARNDDLLVEKLFDEVLVYDLTRHRAHCLNRTAAVVWQRCDGRTTVADIVRQLEGELRHEVDESVVRLALAQLARAQLLRPVPAGAVRPVSRRAVVKTLGVSALLALPMVTSITVPKAMAAVSCLTNGQACTSDAQCCAPLQCRTILPGVQACSP